LSLAHRLEESGIVTTVELTSYEPEGLLDLNFTANERVQRLIMKVCNLSSRSILISVSNLLNLVDQSEWLRDALLELPPTSEKLTISFSPAPEEDMDDYDQQERDEEESVPLFRLEAAGANGSTEVSPLPFSIVNVQN